MPNVCPACFRLLLTNSIILPFQICLKAFSSRIFGALSPGNNTSTFSPVFTCAASCAIGSVISQVGDALASAIKRNHDIKDYGNLIPGHGGILDRFDSMIFTAPAIFFAIYFLG